MQTFRYQLFNRFADIIRTFYVRRFAYLKDILPTPNQMGYLHFLLDHDGCSQQELVDMRFAKRSTISEVVSQMEQSGLLIREKSKTDKRKICLHLTEDGRKAACFIKQEFDCFCEECLGDFSEKEKEQFFYLISKFLEKERSLENTD